MLKLQIIHGAAAALQGEDALIMWRALLELVSGLELESEVLEALCILILANNPPTVSLAEIRGSIPWPSILSDEFLSKSTGTPTLVHSWAKAHSGEAPTYFSTGDIEEELKRGQIVPRILWNRLASLEAESGMPMIKQWAYEFDRLLNRVDISFDGRWSYFSENNQGHIGQFIGRRGHIARSAFLRTLALAYDQWGMPEGRAKFEAMHASPVDFSFLRILPGEPPSWAIPFQNTQPNSAEDWGRTIFEVARAATQQENSRLLLHLNAPVIHSKHFQAEAELITVLHSNENCSIENAFRIHDWLLGKHSIERSHEGQFIIGKMPPDSAFPLDDGSFMLPALLPLVGKHVGYIHSDLMGRMPYLPANFSFESGMKAAPRRGGAYIETSGETVGEFFYWNFQWTPMHNKSLGTPGAVSVTLSEKHATQILQVCGMKYSRVWRVTALTRETDYGEWQESKYSGIIPEGD